MRMLQLTILTATLALGGCSATTTTPEPVSVPVVPEVVAEPAPVRSVPVGRIDIERVLTKLSETGCTVDRFTYREVDDPSRTGGHVDIHCTKKADVLAIDTDL